MFFIVTPERPSWGGLKSMIQIPSQMYLVLGLGLTISDQIKVDQIKMISDQIKMISDQIKMITADLTQLT
jgi:hypothetical protein